MSMVRKKEGVGFGLELHKKVVFKILKLVGALVEPLEDTNVIQMLTWLLLMLLMWPTFLIWLVVGYVEENARKGQAPN